MKSAKKVSGMNADVIVVGGGLAGGLTALRLTQTHPQKKILLLERGERLGDNHTWGFYDTDLSPSGDTSDTARASEPWLQAVISKSWDSHEVRFPKLSRVIETRFHGIRSVDFHNALTKILGRNVRLGCDVVRITDSEVETADGEILRAPLIIDASGITSDQKAPKAFAGAPCGWMKFIGFDLKLKTPHGLTRPLLNDANVPQMDGYRYFSCLPWDETRIFVTENFFSSNSELNEARINRSIRAYAERNGWQIESIERTEEGRLPLPLYALQYDKPSEDAVEFSGEDFVNQSPVSISSRVGFFHSATSHSLPDAVRIAEFISELPQLRTGPVRAALREFRKEWIEQQRFYRLVNRLIFRAVEPSLRYQVLERFYGQREDLIERYFAGTTTRADRPRILGAKPVVRPGRVTKNWADEQPLTPLTPADA